MKELRCRWAKARFGRNPLGNIYISLSLGPQYPRDWIPVAVVTHGPPLDAEPTTWQGRPFLRPR